MAKYQRVLEGYMTSKHLALELRMTTQSLSKLCIAGKGPPRTYVGRKILYRAGAVQDWLRSLEEKS